MKFSALVRYSLLHSFATTFSVLAQIPVNGQTFSKGLAIINAPALNSEHNAPGTLPISIEVSGNGKIPFAGLIPGSGLPTAFEELNIFLVSSQTGANITVSVGPQLLTDETGTVRHLNWQIPTCVQPGLYNMTFYETSRLEGQELYAITPIPISIRNGSPSNDCSNIQNRLESQPQSDRPAPVSPFLPRGTTPAGMPVTVTLPAGRTFPSATGDPSQFTTVIMVVESPTVLLESGNPQTVSMTFTTTATMRTQDLSNFLPVNAGSRTTFISTFSIWTISLALATVLAL